MPQWYNGIAQGYTRKFSKEAFMKPDFFLFKNTNRRASDETPDGHSLLNKKWFRYTLSVIFIGIFSVGFIIIGLLNISAVRTTQNVCSVSSKASVSGYETRLDTTEQPVQTVYTPVITYRAGDRTFQSAASLSSNTRPFEIGQQITIRYNPENPSEFYIPGYDLRAPLMLGIVFLTIGAAVVVITAVHLLQQRRKGC